MRFIALFLLFCFALFAKTCKINTFARGEIFEHEKILPKTLMGLFENENVFYLKKTFPKLKKLKADEAFDGSTYKLTIAHNEKKIFEQALILIDAPLKQSKLKHFITKKHVLPQETIHIKHKNYSYKIFATGNFITPTKQDNTSYSLGDNIRDYKLYISKTFKKKTTTSLLAQAATFDDSMIEILFVGDIDKDGMLDLVIDVSNKYSRSEIALFLSSCAKSNEAVGLVNVVYQTSC